MISGIAFVIIAVLFWYLWSISVQGAGSVDHSPSLLTADIPKCDRSAQPSAPMLSSLSLNWSAWRPLSACWTDRELIWPGLYRIRSVGRDDLDYIGQTGLRLRDRLGMLKGVYGAEMPYRDPHTVGPAL